jgi:UPF0755 protein
MSVSRVLKTGLLLLLLAAAGVAGTVAWWLQRPLPLPVQEPAVVDVRIAPGTSARGVARLLTEAGVRTPEWWLHAWLRASGEARQIKAGAYEIEPGTTPGQLLGKLVRGEQALRRVTLVEGWNYRQVLQALRTAEHLTNDLPETADPRALMQAVGLPHPHPEGRFFPDTYLYPKYATASSVLRQAAQAMERRLQQAWAQRMPDVPLRHPDELLILASIIEKETGLPSDREQVAGVFVNRLRIGMRLQTDPTVIYGLGPGFEGRLRRVHLDTDTPYNTYTRAGLPPTPIAMPSMAALLAAGRPATTDALYFVARGDGSSEFSRTLDEHNRAVRRFILNR